MNPKSKQRSIFLNPGNWKIQSKIVGLLIVVLAIAQVVMAVSNYLTLSNTSIKDTGENLGDVGNEAVQRAMEVINGDIKSLQALALSQSINQALYRANATNDLKTPEQLKAEIATLDQKWKDEDPEIQPLVDAILNSAVSKEINAFMAVFPNEVEVFVTDKAGLNIGMSARTGDYLQADEDWWIKAYAGQISISPVEFDDSTGAYAMNIGVPIYHIDTHAIIGVLRGTVNVTAVFNELAKIQYGETGRASLLDSAGTVLYSTNEELRNQPAPQGYIDLIQKNESTWTSDLEDLDGNPAVLAFEPLQGNLADILGWTMVMDQDLSEVQAPVIQATIQNLLLALLVGGLLIAGGFLMARSISKPILSIAQYADQLALGNATLDDRQQSDLSKITTRKDELGVVGKAFTSIIDYYQDIAGTARQIANGDLTVTVQTKSDKDDLGNSFTQMVNGLRQSVGAITQSALDLAEASEQLSTIANQAGGATNQIAGTIQQIAHGTSQEAESINHTASAVEELSRAIEGVAQGAQEQAAAISKTSMITSQISNAIEQVAGNADAVVRESNNASEAAKQGTQIVDETLAGMQSIKSRVDLSGQKVQEMGKRSVQIGEIVTTIEDIASQTNLLALNAAIEAARAGESGKGFAVVADEVRKLAERSASATREIGDLVKDIQKTVSEAVVAMEEGAHEVDAGVQKANSAGTALTTILSAAEAVTQQAIQAAEAAKQMSVSANELVSAVDTVSAVVEENTAATEEMAASSSEVNRSIENIASISQESSASVEEVSASAEEMSAQVQQVNSSAHELAKLAKNLQDIVHKFQLN